MATETWPFAGVAHAGDGGVSIEWIAVAAHEDGHLAIGLFMLGVVGSIHAAVGVESDEKFSCRTSFSLVATVTMISPIYHEGMGDG